GRLARQASDICALGVMGYGMVTGELPFPGEDSASTLLAIAGGRYVAADQRVPSLSRAVVAAIDAALARDPAQRPASAELLARMAGAGAAPARRWTRARPPTGGEPLPA